MRLGVLCFGLVGDYEEWCGEGEQGECCFEYKGVVYLVQGWYLVYGEVLGNEGSYFGDSYMLLFEGYSWGGGVGCGMVLCSDLGGLILML